MKVADLNARLEAVYFVPNKQGVGTLRMAGGQIVPTGPYRFLNASGGQLGGIVNVTLEATEEQLNSLKTILAAMLQTTNALIEAQHGWVRWVEPGEGP